MKTNVGIEIEQTIERVFDWANNRTPEWSQTVVGERDIERTADVVGSRFVCVTAPPAKNFDPEKDAMEFQGKVLRYDEPSACDVELLGQYFDIMVQYRFDAINDNKTRVAQTSVVKPKGWMMKTMFFLSGPFMRRMNCSAAMEEMQNLKRFCESSDRDQESP